LPQPLLIFKNPDIVEEVVDEGQFNYYLMKMGLFQLNTHLYRSTYLLDIFQTDELYRSGLDDSDVLFKVLLNEEEARLPIQTDCAPYYHWNDFRTYCLDKLDRYK
jgi:hypothetical protein